MREIIHKYIYLVGLCLIAFFLPVSEYITNAAILLIITNFLAEAGYKKKLQKLWATKSILIFILLFFVHIVWLINSKNMGFAMTDIRIKLPLLALPIVIGLSKALSKKQITLISLIFIGGVLLSTSVGVLSNHSILLNPNTENVRNLSVFVSHIRLSLMICLSILLIFHLMNEGFLKNKYLYIPAIIIIAWFILFLGLVQGFTGIISLLIVGLTAFAIRAYNETNKTRRIIMITAVIILPLTILGFLGFQIKQFYTPTAPKSEKQQFTPYGNLYYNDTTSRILENGNLIYADICEKELYAGWNKRSNINPAGKDGQGQVLLHTLIRYMTSKGLKKDFDGIQALTAEDVRHIENGQTNYKFAKHRSISQRIYNTIWQIDVYAKGGNPSGHSLTQRIEYLKYGCILASRNFWIGTGTGDIDDEYKSLYIERRSQMEPQYRHRAHNQFLTFYVSFGVFGAIICFFAWFYPAIIEFKFKNFQFAVFFLIAILSMLTDDTLETTTGVVFIAYFYSLFLWGEK